jgi:hypothetical protein
MSNDASRLDANVDYGNIIGYFVRIDVELPPDALYARTESGSPSGWLALSPDEADAFAAELTLVAELVRKASAERNPST